MHAKVYNSVTEIGESPWDSIVGRNRIICTYNFLLAIEKSNINDCKYYYPVIYDNEKIVAHTCVYSITTDLDTLATGITKKIILFVRLMWKNFLKIKFLECGTPVAIGNTISFANDINKEKALTLLVDCIENIAKINTIGIVLIRDFYENELNFFNNLLKKNFKIVNNLPNTILKVKWNTFEEYLRNLKSYYRCKIVKKIKMARENNLTVEICNDFSNLAEQLQTLWYNTYKNAKEYKREILTKEFFINLNYYLHNRSKVILIKNKSDIIGFGLVAIDNDTLLFMFSGLDYIYCRDYAVYFSILYNVIKLAIEMNKNDIDMGLTTYFPKTDVGAKMVNLYAYLKHTNIFFNPFITNLFIILCQKVKIKTNNIFKE